MPKFNEYPTEATPTDDDTMLIFENASKKNKQTPFSGLWNWMVGKLTNAVIDKLTTENKTVFGAINELNSNILNMSKFFKFSIDNTVGYKSELKNIPPGIYYFNTSVPGSVAINETFLDQSHKDPDWHDYSKTGDGLMFVLGNNVYSNYIAVGYKAVFAFRQLTISNKTWYNTWQYSRQ